MESGNKIVSANVSSEPSCEHPASSFLNALLGGCFIAVGWFFSKLIAWLLLTNVFT